MIDTDGGESFVPDIQVSDDTGYDISAMQDITLQNQEDEVVDESSEDTSSDLQEPETREAGDEPTDLEGDDSEEEDSGFEDEEYGDEVSREARKDEIKFKVGDKEVGVPKDAEVEIKINGKKEKMSLQEALNNASGQIHVSREINRVKEREKQFEARESGFNERVAKVNANAEALLEIKDPYELCEYIADLKGGDPDQIFNEMLQSTAEHIKKYSEMTEREIQLDRENRKYKRLERQREAERKQSETAQASTEREATLKANLGEHGFSIEDYVSTIDELVEKQKNGEELGFGLDTAENPTEDDIVDYMVAKDLYNRVSEGISSVNDDLLQDTEFVHKVEKAVLGTELLHGKMTQSEVNSFVRAALDKDNKALSESLSRKAQKAKSGRVNSQGQEDDDGGPGSLEEFHESLRNLKF